MTYGRNVVFVVIVLGAAIIVALIVRDRPVEVFATVHGLHIWAAFLCSNRTPCDIERTEEEFQAFSVFCHLLPRRNFLLVRAYSADSTAYTRQCDESG